MESFASMIPRERWNELLGMGSVRRYAAGQRLMRQGERADFVLLLVEGRVKVWRDEPEGETIVLAVRWPGELMGERGLYGATDRTATVAAIEPCRAVRIGAHDFNALIRKMELEGLMLQYFAARLAEGEQFRADLMRLKAPQRIARFLARLAETAARHRPDPGGLDIGLSKHDLESAVGLTRQTVWKEMKELSSRGLVTLRENRIVVTDLDGLRDRT